MNPSSSIIYPTERTSAKYVNNERRFEMKLIRMHKEWGWEMWGILGKDGRWFLGFSRAVPTAQRATQV